MSVDAAGAGLVVAGLVVACAAATVAAVRTARHVRVVRLRGPAWPGGASGGGSTARADDLASDPGTRDRLGARTLRAVVSAGTRRRREAEVARALPVAVEGIARSLRAGGSVRTALADAAAAAPPALQRDLELVVRAAEHGIPLRQAIERWADQRPLPGVRLAAAAVILGLDAGSGLARSLDGVASTLYERAALEREVRALSTQARYSAGVLAVAPLLFLGLVGGLEPAALTFLFTTPAGLGCLTVGLALDVAAGWWMASITRRAS